MKRWQDPKIETRADAPRPYYYIRPYVPQAGSAGLQRIQKRIALGYCDETTMRQAHARKQEIMAPINQGKFILQAQIRFAELVEKYREARLPKLGAATQRKYEAHLDNHILPVFGRAELADIDRQSIEAWLNREAGPHSHARLGGGSPREARALNHETGSTPAGEHQKYGGLGWWALHDLRNIMSAIFTAATDWALWSGPNPCAGIKLGAKVERREKRIPNAADLQRFIAALPETVILPAESARLVVLTAVVAGLRVSEVLGLQPGDIDERKGTLQVNRRWHRGAVGPTKSTASKRVRQVGDLAGELAKLGRGRTYIFERGMTPPDDRDLQQHVFRPAAEAVGIYAPGFGMHTFRRLNISWRQEAGATPFEAMKAAGHSKPEMTWQYTVTDAGREREHVETILSRVLTAGGVM